METKQYKEAVLFNENEADNIQRMCLDLALVKRDFEELPADTSLRSNKRSSIINLSKNAFFGNFIDDLIPKSFKESIRFHEKIKFTKQEEYESYKKTFSSHNMKEMSNVVDKIINFASKYESYQPFCGYNKVFLEDALVILMSMHNIRNNENYTFTKDFKIFKNYVLKDSKVNLNTFEASLQDIFGGILPKTDSVIFPTLIENLARIYPLDTFGEKPDRLKEIINQTEVLCKDGPGFECYWVMTLSISLEKSPFQNNKKYKFNFGGINNEYDNLSDATLAFDKFMIEDKVFMPIVLGEREGHNYFIGLWN